MIFRLSTILFLALVLLLGADLSAQKYYESPYSYGDVSPSDFEIESEIIREDDPAVILCDIGASEMGYGARGQGEIQFSRYSRIKVLSKEGLSEGDRSISLYVGESDAQTIYRLKAQVHNLEGGEVVASKLKNKDWTEERYSDKINLVRFSLPNVKVGSIIEVSYEIRDPFWFQLSDWKFQSELPTVYSAYYVYHPNEIGYKLLKLGYYELAEVDQGSEYVTTNRTSVSGGVYRRNHFKFVCENLPAFRQLNLMDDKENYIPRIIGELSYLEQSDGNIKHYFQDWSTSVNEFLDNNTIKYFMKIKKKSFRIPVPESISDTLSQAMYLHRYIQEEVKCSDVGNQLFPQKSPEVIATERISTKNEANWLLVYSLKAQGIKAYPVLATSRNAPKVVETFPIISQFSRVLAGAIIAGEFYILDSSSPFMNFGQIPADLHNGTGLLLARDSPRWIDLYSKQRTASNTMIHFNQFTDGVLKGKMKIRKSGVEAEELRSDTKMQESQVLDALDLSDQWELKLVSCEGLEGESDLVQLEIDATYNVENLGGNYYIPAVLLDGIQENPLVEETRIYPVSYPGTWEKSYTCMIELPKNYTISATPEDAAFSLPEGLAMFQFSAKPVANQLVLSSKIRMMDDSFQSDQYSALRQLYDLIATSHSSMIEIKEK